MGRSGISKGNRPLTGSLQQIPARQPINNGHREKPAGLRGFCGGSFLSTILYSNEAKVKIVESYAGFSSQSLQAGKERVTGSSESFVS